MDRRPGKGEIYFALPNVGIIRDQRRPEQHRSAANRRGHGGNQHAQYKHLVHRRDAVYLSFPGNATNKVYTTTHAGALVNTLDAPTAETPFDDATVTAYFDNPENKFVPYGCGGERRALLRDHRVFESGLGADGGRE